MFYYQLPIISPSFSSLPAFLIIVLTIKSTSYVFRPLCHVVHGARPWRPSHDALAAQRLLVLSRFAVDGVYRDRSLRPKKTFQTGKAEVSNLKIPGTSNYSDGFDFQSQAK